VSGTLGDAGLALRQHRRGVAWSAVSDSLRTRLERPEPRIRAGLELRRIAAAAIDISDGLLADLGHILQASGVGAEIHLARLPLSAEVESAVNADDDWVLPMTAGDDYELCFTVAASRRSEIESLAASLALPLTYIGRIEAAPGLRCVGRDGRLWSPGVAGYEHFRDDE
jgi:thiamine-monophosphate kinase